MAGSKSEASAGRRELAEFVRGHRDEILESWERAVRQLHAARGVSDAELFNSIPMILDQVADMVELLGPGEMRRPPLEATDRHALERLEGGFELDGVISELSLLREATLDPWLRARGIGTADRSAMLTLSRAVDRLIAASVECYVDARDREMTGAFEEAQTRAAELERSQQRLQAATREARRNEAALRESEERYRALVTATSDVVFRMAPDGTELRELHGRDFVADTDEPTASYLDKYIHPDDQPQVKAVIERAIRTRSTVMHEHRVLRLDGTLGWSQTRAVPVKDAGGEIIEWFGAGTDVTERKRAEEEIRESGRRKDEFLAMLGHELRNPLAAIRNAAELLKLTAGDDRRERRTQRVLERQSWHMTRLIDGLLEVSRIARGKVELDCEPVDVRSIVECVVQDRVSELQSRGLELNVDLPAEPVWVWGDRVRLAQVLDNLLGNAAKFTEEGSVTVTLRPENGSAVLAVRDTGVGIRAEMLEQLFDPFQQERQDMARTGGGLGLGLAVAKGLVELHGGSIRARSAGAGAGSEFEVCLPLSARRREAATGEESRAVEPREILIVEDNVDAADMLRDLLELSGHHVGVAENGRDALDTLHGAGVDVVLCDLGLPGMSGYELARAIRDDESLRDVRLVAVTGYGQPEDRRRSQEAGFDAHLTKPIDLRALETVLVK